MIGFRPHPGLPKPSPAQAFAGPDAVRNGPPVGRTAGGAKTPGGRPGWAAYRVSALPGSWCAGKQTGQYSGLTVVTSANIQGGGLVWRMRRA